MNNQWKATTLPLLLLLGLLLGFSPENAYAQLAQKQFLKVKPAEFIANEVLVRYKPNTTATARAQSMHGLAQSSKQLHGGIHQVRLHMTGDVMNTIALLKQDPSVESAQPNYIYRAALAPDDTNYAELWGLKNFAQTIANPSYGTNNPGTATKDMDMEVAWDTRTDCSSILVAVIDTGINYDHTDLAPNMWSTAPHGADFTVSGGPMDDNGHGTHVAGTIGAKGNNASGNTGVCWTATLMAVKVLDKDGSGSTSTVVQGINYAVANSAKVLNLSLGGGSYDSLTYNALLSAKNNGVLVVAAAGNDGLDNETTHHYPSDYNLDNIISVAALDQSYALADFSNYGATSVDVGAPGTNIHSSWYALETSTPAAWGTWTSAGGFVTGVAGPNAYTDGLCNDGYSPAGTCDFFTDGAGYAVSATYEAYVSFAINPNAYSIKATFPGAYNLEANADFLGIYSWGGAGDPFPTNQKIGEITGDGGAFIYNFSYTATNCLASGNCSIGIRMTTDANALTASQDRGVYFGNFNLVVVEPSTTSYHVINGTSMATPHVAGLAALVWAQEPNYNYSDVKASIMEGGVATPALSGKTVSENAVSGSGALDNVRTPHTITASYL